MDQVTQVEKRVILVLAYNMVGLEDAFKALAKKAKKLGVAAPTYTVGEYIPAHTIQGSPQEPGANAFGEIYVPAKYEVTVEGEFPKLPGWIFMGTIEHTEHGNILRAMKDQTIDEAFRTAKPACDHCNTVRQRADTFIVKHEETGDVKRIGRACLKDYLGGKSPEQIAYLMGIERMLREFSEDDMRGGSDGNAIEIVEYLANVVAIVEHQGYYVSRAKAEEKQIGMTSSAALGNLQDARSKDPKILAKVIPVTDAHYKQADEMLQWVREREATTSYEQNLKIISMKAVLSHRDLGMVASISASYSYAMGIIAKKQAELAANREVAKTITFVGEIKKRQHFTVTIDRIMRFENDFGTSYIITMHDEKHNILVWKTSSAPIMPVERKFEDGAKYWHQHHVSEGETYVIKGTVKKYEHYREKPQTVLQRVNFEQRVSEQVTQVQEVVQQSKDV